MSVIPLQGGGKSKRENNYCVYGEAVKQYIYTSPSSHIREARSSERIIIVFTVKQYIYTSPPSHFREAARASERIIIVFTVKP